MKIERTRIQPAKTITFIKKVVCDICGREGSDDFDSTNWNEELYEIYKTAIYLEEGSSYPEGGWAEFKECDICPECFEKHLIPFLESLGVKFRTRETYW